MLRTCQLGRIVGKKTDEFKHSIGDILENEKRKLTITNRFKSRENKNDQNKKYYNYTCGVCGYINGVVQESNLKKLKCPCCTGKTVVEGINDIPTTAPWMIKFFQGGYTEAKKYTKSCSRKITPICPECGNIRTKPISIDNIYANNGFACTCKDGVSYPNKVMYNILKENNIEFINEYSPDWVGNKFYDFYIPSLSLIIEMDGIMHFEESNLTNKSLSSIQQDDIYKEDLAENNGISVVRIDSSYSKIDYIKNSILNSNLLNKLEIKGIDWNKIEESSRKSLYKKVWDLKYNNPLMFTGQISKKLNTSNNTVRRALQIGHKLGKCTYVQREESIRSSIYARGLNKVSVNIKKDDTYIVSFESLTEMYENSDRVLGVVINSRIYNHIKPTGHYKGYDFEFIYPKKKEE